MISALKFCVASWRLLESFLGLPRDFVSNIINKKAYRKPEKASRKAQGSYKNRAEILTIFSFFFGQNDEIKGHFEIN